MDRLKLLDCTLRDGGFYNNWDFKKEFVENYIYYINKTKIDIIEIGYRSILNNDFYGIHKYCYDDQTDDILANNITEVAVMTDLKEFVKEKKFNFKLFEKTFNKTEKSRISWVRVAILNELMPYTNDALQILKESGYKTTINLMQMSLLSVADLTVSLKYLNPKILDVFYFADSFGSMLPKDIKNYLKIIRDNFPGKIGVHTHDNLGLAFANSLEAIDSGADYLDSTVCGMGRGAGNLKTENLLLYIKSLNDNLKYDPYVLLEFIEHYMNNLKSRFKWGQNFNYALSGIKKIHPMYCQKLEELRRYTGDELMQILGNIEQNKMNKYSTENLNTAVVKTHAGTLTDLQIESQNIKKSFGPGYENKNILVIGPGESINEYRQYIQKFISSFSPVVIKCNIIKEFNAEKEIFAILHKKHIKYNLKFLSDKNIITGFFDTEMKEINRNNIFFKYEISLSKFDINEDIIVIPHEVVSMYALGLSLLLNPQKIYLCGFDGYSDSNTNTSSHVKQTEMNEFFSLFLTYIKNKTIAFNSITPTNYEIPKMSVFNLINDYNNE